MDILEYSKLNLNDRADTLWDKGIFVDERIEYGKAKVLIYSLFHFYVEVFYDINQNKITDIKPLNEESDWNGYLKSINLNHLMK